ncbi:guanylate-binding protein 1-like [Mercenaria mercenaria]|uniref:guanylate-binding protein 1-like n=1 Tax=Mercenaria mercenaria TaxID=6596 RepID=UPI00234F2D4C|nr:guanylate-binding protein 1-like [Mercenaria mercenaria]
MAYKGLSVFQRPRCLVNSSANGALQVQENIVCELSKIMDRLVVVAIVGLYRTGKSFLLNRLAGSHSGFRVGRTIKSETRGIWIWCKSHPTQPNSVLVLLDTEGLGDVDKVRFVCL